MLNDKHLFDMYKDQGLVVQGGEHYLSMALASKFLHDCHYKELAVLGVEGFVFKNGSLFPRLDLIADFSSLSAIHWHEYQDACNRAAENFLKSVNIDDESLVFNFVLLSQSEWSKNA